MERSPTWGIDSIAEVKKKVGEHTEPPFFCRTSQICEASKMAKQGSFKPALPPPPQRAPLLTGWCRRGGKGGALPSKCPLFCQSHQLSNAGHQGTRNLRFVPWQGHGSQSKRGGLDGQKPPWGIDSSVWARKKLGERNKTPFFLLQTIAKFAKPAPWQSEVA